MEQIKISEKKAEYVENLEQVEYILNQCEYGLKYVGKGNDNGWKYNAYILNMNDLIFIHKRGLGLPLLTARNKQDIMLDAIWGLLSDRRCVLDATDEKDFICMFGYDKDIEKVEEGYNIYNAIKENNKKLLKAFSNEQLDFLTDNIQF